MFCTHCGAAYEETSAACSACGQPLHPPVFPVAMPVPAARPAALEDSPAMRMLLPVGRSGWAIAAGYLGLLAFLLYPAPIAVVISIVAISDLRTHRKKHGMGRAVFGLVMGILGTVGLVYLLRSILA